MSCSRGGQELPLRTRLERLSDDAWSRGGVYKPGDHVCCKLAFARRACAGEAAVARVAVQRSTTSRARLGARPAGERASDDAHSRRACSSALIHSLAPYNSQSWANQTLFQVSLACVVCRLRPLQLTDSPTPIPRSCGGRPVAAHSARTRRPPLPVHRKYSTAPESSQLFTSFGSVLSASVPCLQAEESKGWVSVQTRFNYAWGSVKSNNKVEVGEGISLLMGKHSGRLAVWRARWCGSG